MGAHRAGNARHHGPELARFPFERIAEDSGVTPADPRLRGRRQRQRRRSDEADVAGDSPGFGVSAPPRARSWRPGQFQSKALDDLRDIGQACSDPRPSARMR